MAIGLRAAFVRALIAMAPSISRVAPYRCRYWLAFMPIQFAADMAPNGARHCCQPDTRPPPVGRRPNAAYVDSQTVRKQSTWRQRPAATASMAAITAPPGPGMSPPPLIHVGL